MDSGMINPMDTTVAKNGVDRPIMSLIINKCWRDGEIETLKWLIDTYGIDLYKVPCSQSPADEVYVSFLVEVLHTIHDNRIHDAYNNGVLRRKYEYDGNPKSGDNWETSSLKRFVEFAKYLSEKFPALPLSEKLSKDQDETVYGDLEHWLRDALLVGRLSSSYEGERESAKELISMVTGCHV
jgi:hypothetical protein